MGHTDSRFYELEDIHDDRLKKKNFFPVRNFYALLYPFEVKKGPKFELFSQKNSYSFIFGQNQIFCFFLNCITLVKTVTQRIFDKRFCCLYMSVFVLAKSIFLAFFAPFSRASIKELILSQFWPKTKKICFFSNCITLVKTVTQPIFDKRFCCFHISAFFLTKSIF